MDIAVRLSSGMEIRCRSVIVVPAAALDDATLIRFFTSGSQVQSKHEFKALAEVALIQFDDEELTIESTEGMIMVVGGPKGYRLESGVLICRQYSDALVVYGNTDQSLRKYITAAYRYCTRWVRLDI